MPKIQIETRKLVTLLLTASFCYMSVTKQVDSKDFMYVFTIIVGFYFGGSTALDDPMSKKKGVDSNDKTT